MWCRLGQPRQEAQHLYLASYRAGQSRLGQHHEGVGLLGLLVAQQATVRWTLWHEPEAQGKCGGCGEGPVAGEIRIFRQLALAVQAKQIAAEPGQQIGHHGIPTEGKHRPTEDHCRLEVVLRTDLAVAGHEALQACAAEKNPECVRFQQHALTEQLLWS